MEVNEGDVWYKMQVRRLVAEGIKVDWGDEEIEGMEREIGKDKEIVEKCQAMKKTGSCGVNVELVRARALIEIAKISGEGL